MAQGSYKNSSNSFLMLLSLTAVFFMSLYYLNANGILSLGARAARGEKVETGTLVLSTQSTCNKGTHALVKESGKCTSIVISGVDGLLGSRVRATGVYKNNILYASEVVDLGNSNSPVVVVSPRPSNFPYPSVEPRKASPKPNAY